MCVANGGKPHGRTLHGRPSAQDESCSPAHSASRDVLGFLRSCPNAVLPSRSTQSADSSSAEASPPPSDSEMEPTGMCLGLNEIWSEWGRPKMKVDRLEHGNQSTLVAEATRALPYPTSLQSPPCACVFSTSAVSRQE